MAVDWKTVTQTPTGWKVQDINGEDWFDVTRFGIKGPGQLIDALAEENRVLRQTLKRVVDVLRADPKFQLIAVAEDVLAQPAAKF